MRIGDFFAGIGGFSAGFERAGFQTAYWVEKDERCRELLKRRWPGVPGFGDISKLHDPPEAEVWCGGFPCFPAGALILTEEGLRPIEEIQEGDRVLTHQNRWRRVTKTFVRYGAQTLVLKGHGHPGLETTPEHPIYSMRREIRWDKTRRTYYRWFAEPTWVAAREMQDSYWASPVDIPGTDIPQPRPWWVIGVWLGDGWVNKNSVYISCNPRDSDVLASTLQDAGIDAYQDEERTAIKFRWTDGDLAKWLAKHFGSGAAGKGLPSWVYGLDEKDKRELLAGYLWADGNLGGPTDSYTFRASTVSKRLAVGVKLLAQSVGYSVALYHAVSQRECVVEGRRVNERPLWMLVGQERARSSVRFEGHRYGLVRSVKEGRKDVTVYNLEVEEDNSYVCDGIVVHNCQDVSIAGRRAGLTGKASAHRTGLFFDFMGLVEVSRPPWVVLENVTGLLSSNKGRDMGTVLGTLSELGYRWAYRVLDASRFGVPQRRRRVFIVGRLGERGRHPAEVLFERDIRSRDPKKKRTTQEVFADAAGGGAAAGGGGRGDGGEEQDVGGLTQSTFGSGGADDNDARVVSALQGGGRRGHRLDAEGAAGGQIIVTMRTRHGEPTPEIETTKDHPALRAPGGGSSKPFVMRWREGKPGGGKGELLSDDSLTLAAANDQILFNPYRTSAANEDGFIEGFKPDTVHDALTAQSPPKGRPLVVRGDWAVRRLLPIECERLQGFDDGWTDGFKDSVRYRMLGNAVAVPVVEWIARRLMAVATGQDPDA